jgi:hypothetical protein
MLPLLGLLALALAVTVRAEPAKKADDLDKKSSAIKEKSLLEQRLLSKRFADFKAALLRVKQRLEKGSQEDKDKAQALENALKQIDEAHIDTQFGEMLKILGDTKLTTVGDAQKAMEKSKKLAEEIAKLITILREDNRAAKLRDERKRLEEMIRELEGIIKDSKIVRAKTAMEKMDKGDLVRGQKNINNRTADLNRKLGGKDNKGAEGKAAPKDTRGESKGKGKGEGKEGDPKSKGPDKGESKKNAGEKGNNNKGKKGEGEPKKGDKNGKKNEGEAKKGDPNGKKGEGEPKKGDKNGKGQGEASKSKSKGKGEGESKSKGKGSPSDSKGSGKKGSESKSSSKSSGSQSNPNSNPNNNPNQPNQPQQPQQPQDDTTKARERIQDAQTNQKKAVEKLEEDLKKIAAREQDEAIRKLEDAKKKLEELLRQAREEELERLLTALENRCRQMLEMQRQVKAGTIEVHKAVLANKGKKPNRTNDQDSGRLADKEKEIVLEATKAIEMIEAEGSAVAFAEVFKQVRTDMEDVQKLLEKTKVGLTTQEIEQDIIDTLEEMIKALQKAKQQIQSPPSQGAPPPPQPQDQKLLDLIAELKMIRSMQVKVNKRTRLYADEYVGKEGEQTSDAALKGKLKELSDRQQKLFDVTMKIVKEENK